MISANAQEQLTIKQQADKLYDRGEYFKSLALYQKLTDKGATDIHLIERVAECYRQMNDYRNAEEWYKQAIVDSKADVNDKYYYAETLLRNKKISEARSMYKEYYASKGILSDPTSKLATCDSAAAWMQQPSNFIVKNEEKFNSRYSDWGLNFSGTKDITFASDRLDSDDPKAKEVYNRNGNGYLKLYQVNNDQVTLLPVNSDPTFKDGYHIGPMALNKTADTAYITISTTVKKSELPVEKAKNTAQKLYTRRLQLIVATKVNGVWKDFKSFPYNNVKQYSVGHAALSANGNMLYFTSDMPGSEGKTDIWYCVKQADGTWGKPANCGKAINTKEEEAFPSINGGVLYFSSKGLPGMGGYDIFKANGEGSNWTNILNLRYPVNSTSDDFYYTTLDAVNGYFASNREGGKGDDDIYSASYKAPEVPPVVIARAPAQDPAPAEKEPEEIVLSNIYYDLDKSKIRKDAAVELDKVATVLNEHPDMRIALASYCDSRASASYNLALSKRRAKSVVKYLAGKGIKKERLQTQWYGKTHLVNRCAEHVKCSEAEHQMNRRTEITVVK
jgi:outer membrane protein OmpA-like peptidoglycan-associated protein/tetratricopeptide (TPR) repeat protein